MWSKLDLKDSVSRIPLAKSARPIFKVTTPSGDFQPTIMPQGYCNAPSVFQREIDHCLQTVQDIANAYFDDIISGTSRDDENQSEFGNTITSSKKFWKSSKQEIGCSISKSASFLRTRWNFADTFWRTAREEFLPDGSWQLKNGQCLLP